MVDGGGDQRDDVRPHEDYVLHVEGRPRISEGTSRPSQQVSASRRVRRGGRSEETFATRENTWYITKLCAVT